MKYIKFFFLIISTIILYSSIGLTQINDDSNVLKIRHMLCIEEGLTELFPEQDIEINNFYRLTDGKSNDYLYCVQLVQPKAIKLVFRFIPYLKDYQRQYLYSKAAENSNLGPKVLYANKENCLFAMEFIEGESLSPTLLEDRVILEKFAYALYEIQHMQVESLEKFDVFEVIERKIEKYRKSTELQLSAQLDHYKSLLHIIKQAIAKHDILLVPSHNDIHMKNVFYDKDKNIKFIDWDNGGISDPFYDLACASIKLHFSAEQIDFFLRAYFSRDISSDEYAHFLLMQLAVIIEIALFFLEQNEVDNATIDFVKTFFNKIKHPVSGFNNSQDIAYAFFDLFDQKIKSEEYQKIFVPILL